MGSFGTMGCPRGNLWFYHATAHSSCIAMNRLTIIWKCIFLAIIGTTGNSRGVPLGTIVFSRQNISCDVSFFMPCHATVGSKSIFDYSSHFWLVIIGCFEGTLIWIIVLENNEKYQIMAFLNLDSLITFDEGNMCFNSRKCLVMVRSS